MLEEPLAEPVGLGTEEELEGILEAPEDVSEGELEGMLEAPEDVSEDLEGVVGVVSEAVP